MRVRVFGPSIPREPEVYLKLVESGGQVSIKMVKEDGTEVVAPYIAHFGIEDGKVALNLATSPNGEFVKRDGSYIQVRK